MGMGCSPQPGRHGSDAATHATDAAAATPGPSAARTHARSARTLEAALRLVDEVSAAGVGEVQREDVAQRVQPRDGAGVHRAVLADLRREARRGVGGGHRDLLCITRRAQSALPLPRPSPPMPAWPMAHTMGPFSPPMPTWPMAHTMADVT